MMMQVPLPPAPPAPPEFPTQVIVGGSPPPWVTMDPAAIVMISLGFFVVAGLVLWPLLRAIARRIERGPGGVDRAELDELRQRVAELEERQGRMFELEERLDFTERLLAERSREPERFDSGEKGR